MLEPEPRIPDSSPAAPAQVRTALLLANTKARQVRELMPEVIERLRAGGLELIVQSDDGGRSMSELLLQHRHEVTLVIVAGGDGTLNAVADALVEAGLPLGIVPLGTANDLARTLRIPFEVEAACRVILEGHQRRIDLGWVNGKHFFNVASLGLSAKISRQLDAESKKRWGVLAYLFTAVKVLWQMRFFRAEIRTGQESWHVKSVQITVGNGRFYGGGMAVAEDATIDDQRLDLYSLEVRHWWELLELFWSLRRGQLANLRGVRTLQGQQFEIRTRRRRWINTDGELTVRTPAVFRTVPLALSVLTPRETNDPKTTESAAAADDLYGVVAIR